jgi:hypothetical protein
LILTGWAFSLSFAIDFSLESFKIQNVAESDAEAYYTAAQYDSGLFWSSLTTQSKRQSTKPLVIRWSTVNLVFETKDQSATILSRESKEEIFAPSRGETSGKSLTLIFTQISKQSILSSSR